MGRRQLLRFEFTHFQSIWETEISLTKLKIKGEDGRQNEHPPKVENPLSPLLLKSFSFNKR